MEKAGGGKTGIRRRLNVGRAEGGTWLGRKPMLDERGL